VKVQELPNKAAAHVEQVDQYVREQQRRTLGLTVFTSPGEPIQERLVDHNSIALTGGEHGGAHLEREYSQLLGSCDAVIVRKLRCSSSAVISGVRFASIQRVASRNNQDALVEIAAAAKVVFHGCFFSKENRDTGDFVSIAAGGQAAFIGCVFEGGGGATNCINNAGLAGDVFTVGCLRTTAAAHVNTTDSAEIT